MRYGLFLGGSHISCLGGHETKPVQILVYFFKNVKGLRLGRSHAPFVMFTSARPSVVVKCVHV